MRFMTMVTGWARIAEQYGRMPEDARPWLAKYGSRRPA
jgi:hypothetical protein